MIGGAVGGINATMWPEKQPMSSQRVASLQKKMWCKFSSALSGVPPLGAAEKIAQDLFGTARIFYANNLLGVLCQSKIIEKIGSNGGTFYAARGAIKVTLRNGPTWLRRRSCSEWARSSVCPISTI